VTSSKLLNVPRFFPDEVNRIPFDGNPPAGRVVIGGKSVTDAEIQGMALDILRGLAEARGIPERSITKAIFEGRLNPHWDDLTLAYQGLRRYVTTSNGARNYGEIDLKWNQMFGSIAEHSPFSIYSTVARRSQVFIWTTTNCGLGAKIRLPQ
jgi:hypothetical protein